MLKIKMGSLTFDYLKQNKGVTLKNENTIVYINNEQIVLKIIKFFEHEDMPYSSIFR